MARQKMLAQVGDLGLGAFGSGGLGPFGGFALGGGVSAVTMLGFSHMAGGKLQHNADAIGLVAGLATAGVLASMPRTRRAALPAALGAVFASGISWLNRVLFGTVQLPAATAAAASQVAQQAGMSGLGLSTTRALGIARTKQLGLSTTGVRSTPAGTIPGVAGPRMGNGRPPINLMGNGPGAAQVSLMGGPQIHGAIAGHYGATHFSGR